jgi:phosphoribosyl 1,2-cyclic phosphodiesterase
LLCNVHAPVAFRGGSFRMTLAFSVLGSGSAGNSTLVALNGHAAASPRFILIDAGLTPRATRQRLAQLGVRIDQITDIIFTHLDQDHYRRTWQRPAAAHGITLHIHAAHRSRARVEGLERARVRWFEREVHFDGDTRIESAPFDHDRDGTVGYVIEHPAAGGARLGYATDLGRVPPWLCDWFRDVDGLALESNYDPQMQLESRRPWMLKRRIMGGRGHLSNEQAMEAVLRIASCAQLSHVALLHLSRQCNCPKLVKRLYAERAPHLIDVLTVTSQFYPTPLLAIDPPRLRGEPKQRPAARPDPYTWVREPELPFPQPRPKA